MYLAMNRFRVKTGQESAFEEVWKTRDSRLTEVPGFVSFHLLRGPGREGHTLYASHTIWASEEDFTAWTKSEAFRMAHRSAGSTGDIYAGAPELELFSSVQSISA
ncbi:antibiotic biosynthesis monooxygenase family protein [Rhodobacter sp. NSM]|uniref:antibiotic biosynthesis monooxygenase family protein n=1 Tax=Rhodobacter sp. NSM TaxID=3457501 RepID=UPI003FCFD8F5